MIVDNTLFFTHVRELLSSGRQVQLRVTGNSMCPFLREGDEVRIKAAEGITIKKGDVVLATWRQGYVLHRVVQVRRQQFLLAGDNNLAQIEYIGAVQLLAVVTAAYRAGDLLYHDSARMCWLGLAWYYVRPLRRVWVKVHGLLTRR